MYAKLQPLPHILSKINDNKSQLGADYIAVHIRRTDHITSAKENNKYTSDEDFINFIDANPNVNLYIATDNRDTQDKFYARYSNRIKVITFIDPVRQLRQTSLDTAVIDIFTCAGASSFMGSGWSSFTDLINLLRD